MCDNQGVDVVMCVCDDRGLYVTINDIDHVYEILCNWPETDVKVRLMLLIQYTALLVGWFGFNGAFNTV